VRPSLRFLLVAVIGWAGVRAASLGMIPGADMFSMKANNAQTPPAPVVATQFPEIEPIAPAPEAPPPYQTASMAYPAQMQGAPPIVVPIQYVYRTSAAAPPQQQQQQQQAVWNLPEPRRQLYFPTDRPGGDWQVSHLAATSAAPAQSRVTEPMQSVAPSVLARRLDRIQLAMWAMLRSRQDLTGATSLASGGTLGGSQAGARLFYYVTPDVAAVLRSSSEVNRRGGELALGVRVRPLRSIPLWVTAERRQRLGKFGGGRNAFALFAESGVYDQPMPWGFTLDGYAQAGIVGLSSRDLFADGGAAFTRPVYRNFSAGFGVWGGIQPGLYRVDAGPRITMTVRRNIKVHFDYRQRLAGNAQPGSGPVVTLAGDF
jgi:hypothetical protein